MSESKIYSFIGLARKAGAVSAGELAAENALRHGKAFYVIIASDASQNTVKKFTDYCGTRKVKAVRFGSKNGLGDILGREMYSVIAITDRRFSDRIEEMIDIESKHKNSDNTVNG